MPYKDPAKKREYDKGKRQRRKERRSRGTKSPSIDRRWPSKPQPAPERTYVTSWIDRAQVKAYGYIGELKLKHF